MTESVALVPVVHVPCDLALGNLGAHRPRVVLVERASRELQLRSITEMASSYSRQELCIAIFLLNRSRDDFGFSILARWAGITERDLRRGHIRDWEALARAASQLTSADIHVLDDPNCSRDTVDKACRGLSKSHGAPDLIIIAPLEALARNSPEPELQLQRLADENCSTVVAF